MRNETVQDLIGMFKETIVLYAGEPVKVLEINNDKQFKILVLRTQRTTVVPWDFTKFRNPTRRLGMVNLNNTCAYVSRVPVRKYWAGLHRNNLVVQALQGDRYGHLEYAKAAMAQLSEMGIADSLNNAYPTFQEAAKWVKEFYGTYAFDKQFALNTDGLVFYKTMRVGRWDQQMKSEKEIRFDPQYEYLNVLLDPSLEINRTH